MPSPCERCSRSEEILSTKSLDLLAFSRVRVDLVDTREGHVYSRPMPLATFGFEPNRPETPPSLDFSVDRAEQTGETAGTSTSREHRPAPIELPCP
jgi:hypothetical protein